ncbi:(2S)-3-sulfopropanediol dehydratase activating enzyme [Oribacterium sp. WCC10]|uniref:(2S)-3-sulfopropanediol dehydratase activating enzyme n=1 Tax=Oribacterium sp. WCC10 TaxID=1855343 RepID=UPI0008DFA338|nr:glycyl-radical enzyme activating protein [Oribacterium sp. WCC10]SFG63542.1 pyruvate formate lyase activating enzyme [Oribacterium sp. WCC10]
MNKSGVVFNVQRFTIHDGPGLRTEIFLKGCPLKCKWCSNPESQRKSPEPGLYSKRCIGKKQCGECLDVCPEKDILHFTRNRLSGLDREKCTGCMSCVEGCPSDAIKVWGKEMSVSECMDIIIRDRGYYEESRGGVTVSGGEPLMQADFVAGLFKECREEGINTCLESTFFAGRTEIEKVLPYTDILISDIKMMDPVKHKTFTGVDNRLILENLKILSESRDDLILRIPVIPHINDDMENISQTADFILEELQNHVKVLQLLSYMRLGIEKYESLGREYPMKDLRFNRPAFQKRVEKIRDYFEERGINCTVGTGAKN